MGIYCNKCNMMMKMLLEHSYLAPRDRAPLVVPIPLPIPEVPRLLELDVFWDI